LSLFTRRGTVAYLLENGLFLIGDPPELFHGDLLIEGDRIAQVEKRVFILNVPGVVTIDCQNYLVTPGFINAHIHPNQLLNRGFLEGLSTDDLLAGMHGRHESKSDDDRYWASLVSIGEALRCGTTFFSAFASEVSRIGEALRDAGVRGTLTVAPKDQWLGNGPTPEVRNTAKVLARLRDHAATKPAPLITASIGAASEKGASAELLRGIVKIAGDTGARVFMHVAEGRSAVEVSRRLHDSNPIAYLDKIGFLGPHVCLIHASGVTPEEIPLLATSSTAVAHCPISNAKTAAGVLPLEHVLDAGIPVGLGTDAASTGNTNNILVEGYFCALIHRVASSTMWPSARVVYKMLTTGGAAAVGMEHEIGQIRPGYKADLALWDLRQSAFLSNLADPISAFVFAASELTASRVFIDGRLVFDREPLMFDSRAAASRVAEYANTLRV
jgi:5-methylthioadenosine/S-adenosylhomocysteine deaminase